MRTSRFHAAAVVVAALSSTALGSTVQFSNANGLSAQATFSLQNGGNTLQIALRNTTSTVPSGFGASDRLLTSIAFDMGGVSILGTGSSVATGASSYSVNFGSSYFSGGSDVSDEYGYGNGSSTSTLPGFTGLTNHVSTNTSHTTSFNGNNLGGPAGGLISTAGLTGFGNGQGAIHDEIIMTLALSSALSDLSFLGNGVRVEYGSDRAFLDGTMTSTLIPLPGAASMAGLGMLLVSTRRRR